MRREDDYYFILFYFNFAAKFLPFLNLFEFILFRKFMNKKCKRKCNIIGNKFVFNAMFFDTFLNWLHKLRQVGGT